MCDKALEGAYCMHFEHNTKSQFPDWRVESQKSMPRGSGSAAAEVGWWL